MFIWNGRWGHVVPPMFFDVMQATAQLRVLQPRQILKLNARVLQDACGHSFTGYLILVIQQACPQKLLFNRRILMVSLQMWTHSDSFQLFYKAISPLRTHYNIPGYITMCSGVVRLAIVATGYTNSKLYLFSEKRKLWSEAGITRRVIIFWQLICLIA